MTHNPTTNPTSRVLGLPVQPSELVASDLERAFDTRFKQIAPDAPDAIPEYRFTTMRKYRFDRAWPEQRVAVELEGGVWSNGRHVRPEGFEKDCAKYNTATALGWRVFRYTTKMLNDDPVLCVMQVAAALGMEVRQ
jgi:hypothetical protein